MSYFDNDPDKDSNRIIVTFVLLVVCSGFILVDAIFDSCQALGNIIQGAIR